MCLKPPDSHASPGHSKRFACYGRGSGVSGGILLGLGPWDFTCGSSRAFDSRFAFTKFVLGPASNHMTASFNTRASGSKRQWGIAMLIDLIMLVGFNCRITWGPTVRDSEAFVLKSRNANSRPLWSWQFAGLSAIVCCSVV